jgi:hypothetical protein
LAACKGICQSSGLAAARAARAFASVTAGRSLTSTVKGTVSFSQRMLTRAEASPVGSMPKASHSCTSAVVCGLAFTRSTSFFSS